MPPEQLAGQDVDARTDVFAFGVVAWELATGVHPLGASAAELMGRMADMLDGKTVTPVGPPFRSPASSPSCGAACGGIRRALSIGRVHPAGSPVAPPDRRRAGRHARAAGFRRTPLWWWQFHQAIIALVIAAMPVAVWFVRRYTAPPESGFPRGARALDGLGDDQAEPALHLAREPAAPRRPGRESIGRWRSSRRCWECCCWRPRPSSPARTTGWRRCWSRSPSPPSRRSASSSPPRQRRRESARRMNTCYVLRCYGATCSKRQRSLRATCVWHVQRSRSVRTWQGTLHPHVARRTSFSHLAHPQHVTL